VSVPLVRLQARSSRRFIDATNNFGRHLLSCSLLGWRLDVPMEGAIRLILLRGEAVSCSSDQAAQCGRPINLPVRLRVQTVHENGARSLAALLKNADGFNLPRIKTGLAGRICGPRAAIAQLVRAIR
jgi:hypothetical protein